MQIELGSLIVSIITFCGFAITIITIVYQAGKLHERIESIGKKFDQHEVEDKREFDAVYERVNGHGEDISALKASHRAISKAHGQKSVLDT